MSGIGSRVDGNGLVQGLGRFLDDIAPRDVVHGHFLRSVLAHANISHLDVTPARKGAGVHAIYSCADLNLEPIPGQGRHGPPAPHMTRPPLADQRVRYVGEPIAVVVAESPALAADAAEQVDIEYDELQAVVDPVEAARDHVLLFDAAQTNVVDRTQSLADPRPIPEISATVEVTNQRVSPLAIEPHGIVVDPREGRLHVWCGHQAPHRLRAQLATLLGIPADNIRVTVPNVGGGFGGKGMFYPEYAVIAAAALRLGRPVKWIATRREDMTGGVHGRAQKHRLTLGGDRSGRITHASVEILADLGAYPHNASMIPGFTRFMTPGPYRIETISTTTTMVVTNTAPIGTYRGAGRPEATYALERAIDAFAGEAGIDPIELRRMNLLDENELPYQTFSGALYDSGRYVAVLDLALETVDIGSLRAEQVRRRGTDRPALGVGVAFYLERAGGPINEGEHASVAIDEDGDMTVRVGAVDTGQGHDRVWKSIAGGPFDLGPRAIRVISGDTDLVADGVGTFASRSTQVCGSVVKRCAEELHAIVRGLAAEMLEVAPDDVVASDGHFGVVDRSDVTVDLPSIYRRAVEVDIDLTVTETWVPGAHTFPYGAHVAVVEVDLETGDVRLLRAIAVDDCGNIVDPIGANGQVHGSLAQGIGQARYEAIEYDMHGQPLTSSMVDYLAPRASDLPMFETSHVVTPAPSNPLGAKGVGESGCIGFPPAFVSAVSDAVRPTDISTVDMPLQPQRVWRAIREATGTVYSSDEPWSENND